MKTFNYVIKIDDYGDNEYGNVQYVYLDEYGYLGVSDFPKPTTTEQCKNLVERLHDTTPREMINGEGTRSLWLPTDIHRVSGANYENPSKKFILKIVQVDMIYDWIDVLAKYTFDVKLNPPVVKINQLI